MGGGVKSRKTVLKGSLMPQSVIGREFSSTSELQPNYKFYFTIIAIRPC